MQKIPLTQGKIALIDDSDLTRVGPLKWQAHRMRHIWYAEHSWRTLSGTKAVKLHRFILGITDPNIQVDHIDRDGLNCQKSNLRVCEFKGQNNFNQGLRKDNPSGYKGVLWNKANQRWQAKITIDGIQKHLGCFDNPVDAARAYDEAAKKYFGEFARLNFKNS